MGLYSNSDDFMYSTADYNRAVTDHSISIWVRLDENSGFFAARSPFGISTEWQMRTGFWFSADLEDNLLDSGTTPSVGLTLGTWHHLACCIDVANTDRFLYLDGVLVASETAATFSVAQSGPMYIGSTGGGFYGWYGALDDFRIYNRVLTPGEIQTIHACMGTDGIIDDIEHWWPMDDGVENSTVTVLTDIIGGLNLTNVSGAPTYNYDAGITRRRYA